MIKQKYKTKEVVETKNILVEESIVCNKCGKEVKLIGKDYEREWIANTFQSFQCHFGYGSNYDMERWNFELCEDCLTDIIKTFKYPPSGFMEEDKYTIIKSDEEKQKVFEHWKQTNEWDELLCKSYEEIVELSSIFDLNYINDYIKHKFPDKPLIEE